MKYLFFDIECSNCFNGQNKICEFGYVVTDEQLNILKKEDIPMSPGNKNNKDDRFDSSIYERDPSLDWAYDIDFYFTCEKFPYFYKKIKQLFNDSFMVFGFSVGNDVRYLNSEFKRYRQASFLNKVCDIQQIIKHYINQVMGVESAFKHFNPNESLVGLVPHLSRDDAYMSMKILKGIMIKYNVTIEDIIKECPECYFNVEEYLNKSKKNRGSKIPKECRELWDKFCEEYDNSIHINNKTCTISKTIKEHKKTLINVMEFIKANQLIPSKKTEGVDAIIVYDEADKERLQQIFKKEFEGEFIKYSDLTELVKC